MQTDPNLIQPRPAPETIEASEPNTVLEPLGAATTLEDVNPIQMTPAMKRAIALHRANQRRNAKGAFGQSLRKRDVIARRIRKNRALRRGAVTKPE